MTTSNNVTAAVVICLHQSSLFRGWCLISPSYRMTSSFSWGVAQFAGGTAPSDLDRHPPLAPLSTSFRTFFEQFSSSFRGVFEEFSSGFWRVWNSFIVSEQFHSFRAVSEQFWAVSEQFWSSFGAVLEQFPSSFRKVLEQFSEHFQSSFQADFRQFGTVS